MKVISSHNHIISVSDALMALPGGVVVDLPFSSSESNRGVRINSIDVFSSLSSVDVTYVRTSSPKIFLIGAREQLKLLDDASLYDKYRLAVGTVEGNLIISPFIIQTDVPGGFVKFYSLSNLTWDMYRSVVGVLPLGVILGDVFHLVSDINQSVYLPPLNLECILNIQYDRVQLSDSEMIGKLV